MHWLIDSEGQRHLLIFGSKNTIGRSESNTVIIASSNVSKFHAVITITALNNTTTVEDLDSTNGTFIMKDHEWIRIVGSQVVTDATFLRFGTDKDIYQYNCDVQEEEGSVTVIQDKAIVSAAAESIADHSPVTRNTANTAVESMYLEIMGNLETTLYIPSSKQSQKDLSDSLIIEVLAEAENIDKDCAYSTVDKVSEIADELQYVMKQTQILCDADDTDLNDSLELNVTCNENSSEVLQNLVISLRDLSHNHMIQALARVSTDEGSLSFPTYADVLQRLVLFYQRRPSTIKEKDFYGIVVRVVSHLYADIKTAVKQLRSISCQVDKLTQRHLRSNRNLLQSLNRDNLQGEAFSVVDQSLEGEAKVAVDSLVQTGSSNNGGEGGVMSVASSRSSLSSELMELRRLKESVRTSGGSLPKSTRHKSLRYSDSAASLEERVLQESLSKIAVLSLQSDAIDRSIEKDVRRVLEPAPSTGTLKQHSGTHKQVASPSVKATTTTAPAVAGSENLTQSSTTVLENHTQSSASQEHTDPMDSITQKKYFKWCLRRLSSFFAKYEATQLSKGFQLWRRRVTELKAVQDRKRDGAKAIYVALRRLQTRRLQSGLARWVRHNQSSKLRAMYDAVLVSLRGHLDDMHHTMMSSMAVDAASSGAVAAMNKELLLLRNEQYRVIEEYQLKLLSLQRINKGPVSSSKDVALQFLMSREKEVMAARQEAALLKEELDILLNRCSMESSAFEPDLVCLPDIDVSALGIVGSVRKRALQVMIDEINQLRAHRSIAKAEMKFIKEQLALETLHSVNQRRAIQHLEHQLSSLKNITSRNIHN